MLKPLDIQDILKMSDEVFIASVYERNNFTFKGRKRRFKYRTTNERVDDLSQLLNVQSDQNVLAVSGSGIQLFELLAESVRVPKIILAFDYSPKQVAYNYLLKAAIESLSFLEFQAYFGLSEYKINRTNIRNTIEGKVPKRFRGCLQRKHEFNKRDLLLNSVNNVTWLRAEGKYCSVKKNIRCAKFFEYELSHKNLNLSRIFKPNSFDSVYLSNVLDWLCWHNHDIVNEDPVIAVLEDIRTVMKRNGAVVLISLMNKLSYASTFLSDFDISYKEVKRVYKYKWLTCKIPVKGLPPI